MLAGLGPENPSFLGNQHDALAAAEILCIGLLGMKSKRIETNLEMACGLVDGTVCDAAGCLPQRDERCDTPESERACGPERQQTQLISDKHRRPPTTPASVTSSSSLLTAH